MALGVTATTANVREKASLTAGMIVTLCKGDLVTQGPIDQSSPDGPWHYVTCTYANPNIVNPKHTPAQRLGSKGWSQMQWYGNI